MTAAAAVIRTGQETDVLVALPKGLEKKVKKSSVSENVDFQLLCTIFVFRLKGFMSSFQATGEEQLGEG